MKIEKSKGVTRTERMLAGFCERSFLKLWSYPNPFKDDGNELCDLLVVFENQVFIFFDREAQLPDSSIKEPQVLWERWRRKVIDKQIASARGAERYVRSGRPMYLDAKKQMPFPLSVDLQRIIIHKIVVAHGATEACLSFSDANVFGSLAINYSDNPGESELPFVINLSKEDPVHIFDSHNLPIVLGELDTIVDFSTYLSAKIDAIKKLAMLSYCGEEDLLAHYLFNLDETTKRHFIGVRDATVNFVHIDEGQWKEFVEMPVYKRTKEANRDSYFWDDIIQRTGQNALDGTLLGSSPMRGRSAIIEMAKEPRFMRRSLTQALRSAVADFPETTTGFVRKVTLVSSATPKKAYVLLQLRAPEHIRREAAYRGNRQAILEVACASAKNKLPELETIVGIAIDAPIFVRVDGEDFMLMDCRDWPEEMRRHYESLNKDLGFFQSPSLRQGDMHTTEFVHPTPDAQRGGEMVG